MVNVVISFVVLGVYFLFLVEVSTILQLLKLPGSASEWRRSYETILGSVWVWEEGVVVDFVWYSVQFVGAPGDLKDWSEVVKNCMDNILYLQTILTE